MTTIITRQNLPRRADPLPTRPHFTLVRTGWYEHCSFAFPGYEATPPERVYRRPVAEAPSLDQVMRRRAALVKDYQRCGYSYRNLPSGGCRLWKQVEDAPHFYHFVQFHVEKTT